MTKRGKLLIAAVLLVGLVAGVAIGVRLRPRNSEADWIYQAAAIMRQFEQIGAGQMPQADRQNAYVKLLYATSQLSNGDVLLARESRGRKAFASLMSTRIYEQLGDAEAAERERKKYEAAAKNVSDSDKAMLTGLTEPERKMAPLPVARFCEVEVKGEKKGQDTEVRVRAVDYPIRLLLRKIADTAGFKMDIAPEIRGLADYVSERWEPAGAAVESILLPRGLDWEDGENGTLKVLVDDELYCASLSERADEYRSDVKPVHPKSGIETGYVIVDGKYIPPPYSVELRKTEKTCSVLLNGVIVDECPLEMPPGTKQPPLPPSGQFEDGGKLLTYTGMEFANIREEYGVDEAIKRMSAFLRSQKKVERFKFAEDGSSVVIFLRDDPLGGNDLLLRTVPATKGKGAKRGNGAGVVLKDQVIKPGTAIAEETYASVQKTLRGNGMVVRMRNGEFMFCDANQATRILEAVSQATQQSVRNVENLATSLLEDEGILWSQELAWDLYVNVRSRELARRLANEQMEKETSQ